MFYIYIVQSNYEQDGLLSHNIFTINELCYMFIALSSMHHQT